jgi:aspartate aminotransferase
MKPFANRGMKLPINLIAETAKRGKVLQKKGLDIISLNQGQPDFPTPEHIVYAAYNAARNGYTKYVPNHGIPELRKAVAEKLFNINKITYDPTDILITNGGALGVYLTNMALVESGTEVIAFEPYFGTYATSVTLAQGKFVTVPMQIKNGQFCISPDLLEQAITPNTKLIILNSPSNPTGSILTQEELEAVADIVLRHDLWVLSDEVYESIIYNSNKHISIASISKELVERTIIINSFSKSYSMTGWRLGYIASKNPQLIKIMSDIYHLSARCATSFVQYAGLAALTGPQDALYTMVAEYERRRDFVVEKLSEIRGFNCTKPKGSFYVFVDVSDYNMDSISFCNRLLEEAKVAVTPGKYFGKNCDKHLRLSFASSMQLLEEGIYRIKKTVESWL